METNPYEYDTSVQWRPQQNQLYEGRYVSARTGQQQPPVLQNQRPQLKNGNQKPRPPEKMPKARALALARSFKKWLVVASLVSFGTFSGLVAFHQVGSTTTASRSTSTSSGSSSTTSSSKSSSSNFLNQGGNNVGSSSSSQGSTSGSSSSSSSSSTPVSGTSTS
jgi:hypothetical protein